MLSQRQCVSRKSNALQLMTYLLPQDKRGLDRERKRDRLRRLWLLAISSPAYIVMTVAVLAFAGPALMAAFGATIGLLTFVALLLQIFLITLAPGVCMYFFVVYA